MAKLARWLLFTGALGLVAALGAAAYYLQWLDRPQAFPEPVLVEVPPGEGLRSLAGRLATAGVLDRPTLFVIHGRTSGDAGRIRAGEYRFVPGLTPRGLLADLVAGRVVTYEVRIVEGWTIDQALAVLRQAPKLGNDLGDVDGAALPAALGLGDGHGEGRFFPDTYRYVKDTPASSILRTAFRRMESVLEAAWRERDPNLPYATPYEALIVASLVEKETGVESDRGKVGRVFASRLERGMRLQSDPTVIYGLGAAFDGDLKRIHLDTDGPYNTYRRGGLPPTPIALPGAASIRATMRPEPGDYLYFVARGDGSSEFTSSLEDHLAAVRRYQLREAPRR